MSAFHNNMLPPLGPHVQLNTANAANLPNNLNTFGLMNSMTRPANAVHHPPLPPSLPPPPPPPPPLPQTPIQAANPNQAHTQTQTQTQMQTHTQAQAQAHVDSVASAPPPSRPPPPPLDSMRAYRACLNCRNRKSKCDLDINAGRPVSCGLPPISTYLTSPLGRVITKPMSSLAAMAHDAWALVGIVTNLAKS
jgi:hypothetical protein